MRSWFLAIGLMGCASAPSTTTPTYPGPPWLDAIYWAHVGDAAALGTIEGEVQEADFFAQRGLYRRVPDAQIPTELETWIGRPLVQVTPRGAVQCEVVPRALVAAFFVDEMKIYGLETAGKADDGEGYVRELSNEAVYERLLERESPQLFFTLETPSKDEFTECDDVDFVGHHFAAGALPVLVRRAAPERLLEAGVAAFREHGFWDTQQAAYERSREQHRRVAREGYERRVAEAQKEGVSAADIAEFHRDTRADRVPSTWDALLSKDASERPIDTPNLGPEGTLWGDASGPQFLSVELGNDTSCAAPRAWMLFRVEGEAIGVIDFGVGPPPTAFLRREGGFDVLLSEGYARSLARLVGDRFEVVRSFSFEGGLQCRHDRLPPVSP